MPPYRIVVEFGNDTYQIAVLFEEWVISILHAKKALELLESRNGLYVLYMDRVTGELANQISNIRRLRELKLDILDDLIHWLKASQSRFVKLFSCNFFVSYMVGLPINFDAADVKVHTYTPKS